MSTRDETSLTARERAALASLEATAAAEDPQLASRLRGASSFRWVTYLPPIPAWWWSSWWGVPVALVGLMLMIVSLSAGLVLGVVGALVMTGGVRMLVGATERSWMDKRRRTDG
jgi:Protein of unknown function (DUF3040)